MISGSGTNLGALLDASASGALAADVALVLSNKSSAGGLVRAHERGVPTRVISHRAFPERQAFDREIVVALREHHVDFVVLAGFMRIVTRELLDAFADRVVNIHPSLLPAFPGVDAQDQALRYGVRFSGCTTHFVDAGTDTGPIIGQRVVPVLPGDSRDSLAARILKHEHELIVATVAALTAGRLSVRADAETGRKIVEIAPGTLGLSQTVAE